MEIIKDIDVLKEKLERLGNGSVGLIHVRGPLNEGHRALIQKAREENFFVVVSNMVIPREFTTPEEYEMYPRYSSQDQTIASLAGADFFFIPTLEAFESIDCVVGIKIKDGLKDELNGLGRPGYYEEQLTTIVKLLNIVKAKNFYMSDEDLQQVYFTKMLLKQMHYDCQLKVLPAVRDENQLLRDERKQFLKADEKKQAVEIARIFTKAQTAYAKGMVSSRKIKWYIENEMSNLYLCKLEFAEIVEPERLRKIETITDEAILMIGIRIGKIRINDYVRLKRV